MSGHSKWATIKRKKAAIDSARGKAFTKIIKEITVAAKIGGGDPEANPRLRLAVQNAKSVNMPQDNINRAIKKGTGELEGVNYEEITYEGYAPHGIAMMIRCLTDNRNRTVADLRYLISKANGNLGESGSVGWMFELKGVITVVKEGVTEDELLEVIMDAGADNMDTEDEFFEITTPLEMFDNVRKAIEGRNFKIENASLDYIAKDLIKVEGKQAEDVMKCIEAVEDNDDVQSVYINADLPEEVTT